MNCTTTKPSGNEYYLQARSDVAELIPYECKSILEIGCGYGSLGRNLAARQNCSIDGVEINPAAEPYLKEIYRRYWIGDIEQLAIDQMHQYDCILLPDVLEHLTDPWATLKQLATHLNADGFVVASVPNIRNLGILYRLLVRGRWEYEESGLLDRGHLRFFTRAEICLLFEKCGLEIEIWKTNHDDYPGFKGLLSRVTRLFISDIDVCQYLIRARKTARV